MFSLRCDGTCFNMLEQQQTKKNKKKRMENCEAMTSSTRSFEYSYRRFKKCVVENYDNFKFHIFLIFYPIYIKFSVRFFVLFTL